LGKPIPGPGAGLGGVPELIFPFHPLLGSTGEGATGVGELLFCSSV